MELSSIDIRSIVFKLEEKLLDYYINKIYSIQEDTILLRLRHSSKAEAHLILRAGEGLWLTTHEIADRSVTPYVSKLREKLDRAKLNGIRQVPGERIVILSFTINQNMLELICEFFGDGNIILVDGERRILSLLRTLRVRDRELLPNREYRTPPARGIDLDSVSLDSLQILTESDLGIARWMGRNLSLSRKYVEDILALLSIPRDKSCKQITKGEVVNILKELNRLNESIKRDSTEPVILLSKEGEPTDLAVRPLRSLPDLNVERFDSILSAADKLFTYRLNTLKSDERLSPTKRALDEIERTIDRQEQKANEAVSNANSLRIKAKEIASFAKSAQSVTEDLLKSIPSLADAKFSSKKGTITIIIYDREIAINASSSLMNLVSKIYDEAKDEERRASSIRKAMRPFLEKKMSLQNSILVEETTKAESTVRKERPWFFNYHWIYTSDGHLAVGGRDASSNGALIRKHLEPKDRVFHADIHGSPFFVLKGNTESSEKSILEVCQAVVIFSRGWRGELAAGDAFWVQPEQVKKHAPSGMYLPKGSFLIEGKKNIVKGLQMRSSVGLVVNNDDLILIGGPRSAIENFSVAILELIPNKGEASDIAKKVKSELIKIYPSGADKIKRIPIDEFVRVLPSGGGRIIFSGTHNPPRKLEF
ncbi:MAG: ribosome rescue protein RqcH [Nitrososphaerales archaeon]